MRSRLFRRGRFDAAGHARNALQGLDKVGRTEQRELRPYVIGRQHAFACLRGQQGCVAASVDGDGCQCGIVSQCEVERGVARDLHHFHARFFSHVGRADAVASVVQTQDVAAALVGQCALSGVRDVDGRMDERLAFRVGHPSAHHAATSFPEHDVSSADDILDACAGKEPRQSLLQRETVRRLLRAGTLQAQPGIVDEMDMPLFLQPAHPLLERGVLGAGECRDRQQYEGEQGLFHRAVIFRSSVFSSTSMTSSSDAASISPVTRRVVSFASSGMR